MFVVIAFPFISIHFPSHPFISFHFLSCTFLSMSSSFPFFPFMSFKLQEIPKSKNYTSFLLNHQFKKYLDQTLSHLGTGIPHKGPKNRLVKAVKKIFHGFFLRGCPHFISLHVHSVPFLSCYPFLFHVLS